MFRNAILAALALASLSSSLHAGETCIASQYGVGDRYNGRCSASGEIFNTWATDPPTAAHRTLPFGTMVTVTHLGNVRACE